jgi:hypothetical protein
MSRTVFTGVSSAALHAALVRPEEEQMKPTRNVNSKLAAFAATLCLAGGAATGAGCGSGDSTPGDEGPGLPQGGDHVDLDPAEFSTEIDNPYWPMRPGSRWVYDEVEAGERLRVVVTVTRRTREVDGIEAVVVHDVVSDPATGEAIEVTDDWYAQDSEGNIWYLGEETAEYEDGKRVSTAGSFEAGMDGAEAGVIMPADPEPGMTYREEHYPGEAEDAATVLSVDEQAQVPAGRYDEALMTSNVNPLEPKVQEYKFYARGVGPVLALHSSPDVGSERLVSFRP